jgi:hypothetical protein
MSTVRYDRVICANPSFVTGIPGGEIEIENHHAGALESRIRLLRGPRQGGPKILRQHMEPAGIFLEVCDNLRRCDRTCHDKGNEYR